MQQELIEPGSEIAKGKMHTLPWPLPDGGTDEATESEPGRGMAAANDSVREDQDEAALVR